VAQREALGIARMTPVDGCIMGIPMGSCNKPWRGWTPTQLIPDGVRPPDIAFGQARVHGAHDGGAPIGYAPCQNQRVANHPAVFGGDSPEGRDGAGKIVRFTLIVTTQSSTKSIPPALSVKEETTRG